MHWGKIIRTFVCNTVFLHRKACCFLLIAVLLACSAGGALANAPDSGEALYLQAKEFETEMNYEQATALYEQALIAFQQEGNANLANACGEAARKLKIVKILYALTLDEFTEQIREQYPQATEEQISVWVSGENVQQYFYDGETHYFTDAVSNLVFRHMELMYADAAEQQTYKTLINDMNSAYEAEEACPWAQYDHPATYRGIHSISIPRGELPATGTIRLWLPVPINGGPQTAVTVESVSPVQWLKLPPSIDQDIGLVYMEIPLDELMEDLNIQVSFTFTHYEQHFMVNPANVGEYDVNSELYKRYTVSSGNTVVTPEILATAQSVVGDETNPYLAARKLYEYVLDNITYSFMPHYVFWPRTEWTESAYVHRYQRGDCGAQSMYFAALCRAVGIPARSTGGWQLFSGEFSSHFWAEFYLPNYGWLPVDTSAAQNYRYVENISNEERQTFLDCFFASQDSMRCVVQKDTDLSLIPAVNVTILAPLAIQVPTVEYSSPTGDILDEAFIDHWTLQCEKID